MATVRHLGFVVLTVKPPVKSSLFGGLYRCTKVGWNRCSSFDNTEVLKGLNVWLENAYSRFLDGFRGLDP